MARPRKNKSNLPKRVYARGNTYIFMSPNQTRDPKDGVMKRIITLGKISDGVAAMMAAYHAIIAEKFADKAGMPYLCQQYAENKLWPNKKLSEDTKKAYASYLRLIADRFENFRTVDVRTMDCCEYLETQYKGKPNTAKKVRALMSRLFKYEISKIGNRQTNPIDQLDTSDHQTERREVLATHEQVRQIREAGMYGIDGRKNLSGIMFACMIDFAYLTWHVWDRWP